MAGPAPSSWSVDPAAAGARLVADGVWRLRLPWCWEGVDHVNSYLLTDGDRHALVDCGPGGHETSLAAFEHALRDTGVGMQDIGQVLLTHSHSDHVGQVREIVRRRGAEVWLHPDTAHIDDVITRPVELAAARVRRARAEGVPEVDLHWFADLREETEMIGEPVRTDHELLPGASVPSPIGPLEVIAAPGHAPSQVGLVQRERNLAFTGDAVCSVFSPYYDYGFTADPVGEQLATLDRLEQLGPLSQAFPGHGRPLADLPAVVDGHRSSVSTELEAVRTAAAEAGPAGAHALSQRAFGVQPTAFGLFLRTVLTEAYLRHLRLRGEVVRHTRPDGRFEHSAVG